MKKIGLLTSLATLLISLTVQAIVITTEGDPTSSGQEIKITLEENIIFTVTKDGPFHAFAFDEIVTNDGELTRLDFSGMSFSINDGASIDLTLWTDNYNHTQNDGTPNDGYMTFGQLTETNVFVGNTVTLYAGTGTATTTNGNFNLWPSNGDVNIFLAQFDGTALSDVIPEPAAITLIALAGFGVIFVRRSFMR